MPEEYTTEEVQLETAKAACKGRTVTITSIAEEFYAFKEEEVRKAVNHVCRNDVNMNVSATTAAERLVWLIKAAQERGGFTAVHDGKAELFLFDDVPMFSILLPVLAGRGGYGAPTIVRYY